MLSKFEVENFMGFKGNFVFDLTSNRKYATHSSFVENGTIKKALIYGRNASGKSNLCRALMDITFHLVDKEKAIIPNHLYWNADNDSMQVKFKYHFRFGSKRVLYEYAKTTCLDLSYEKLYINDVLWLQYDYNEGANNLNRIPGTMHLNRVNLQPQLSMIKYVFSNSILESNNIIVQLVDFVSKMLYFRSLRAPQYVGYRLGGEDMYSIILNNNKLLDFQDFLKKYGLNYNLVPTRNLNGAPIIGVKFSKRVVEFGQIISAGTQTLWLFYCWLLEFEKVKFLIIDEFDAYYHYELSRKVLEKINTFSNLQSVITTHTTYLMKNDLTRPDCCFVVENNEKISSLARMTKKELRESSNFEKMYRDNLFRISE